MRYGSKGTAETLTAVRAAAGAAAVGVTVVMTAATAGGSALLVAFGARRTGAALQVFLRHGEHELNAV